ncbi:CFEM domain-containing protein [Aspergillus karnatakaensis]|uniref:CFEM domain-containing protein n=1 Tax=Aspergillus karnatakaensis TaxID=1810916 RepID=UPI003CCD9E2E
MDLSGQGLSASDLASMDIPTCALKCLIEAVSASTCALTDMACICANQQLNMQLEPCVKASCSIKESLTAKNYTVTTCGVPQSDDSGVFPVTNAVGIVVAILAVGLRLANRAMDRRLGWDDYTIVLSLLFAIAVSAIGLKLKDFGLGKDIWTIPFDDIRMTLKLFFIEEELYGICIAMVKISMLLLYLRLFPNKPLRVAVFVFMGLTAAWGATAFFVLLFSCRPISHYWNKWDGEHEGTCLNQDSILVAHSVINILLDVGITIVPMPILIKLHMTLEKKVGVIAMFAVGVVVTLISIMRLVKTVGFNSTNNPTKDFIPVGIWSLLEFDVAILCACMPAIRALFIRFFKKPTATYAYSDGSNRYNYKGTGGTGPGSAIRDKYSQNLTIKSLGSSGNRSDRREKEKERVDGIRVEQEFIRLEEQEVEGHGEGEGEGDVDKSDGDRDGWTLQQSRGLGGADADGRTNSAARLVRVESR